MKSSKESNVYNYIFIGFIILALSTSIFAFSKSIEQDKQFIKEYLIFRKSMAELSERNYEEAEKLIKYLLPRHEESYLIQWNYGLILKEQGRYLEAEERMRHAREIRPALVTEPKYLFDYGEGLYRLNEMTGAERYLEEYLKSKDATHITEAEKIIKEIKYKKEALVGNEG